MSTISTGAANANTLVGALREVLSVDTDMAVNTSSVNIQSGKLLPLGDIQNYDLYACSIRVVV